jgi:hypothetical protein
MADKRELILLRLLAICTATKTGAGIKTAVRNRGLLSTEQRPGAVLLDGDERPRLTHDRKSGGRPGMTPSIMIMSPELYILLDETMINREGVADDKGSVLNTMRITLTRAISSDADLLALLGSNGEIVYNGCVTDLKSGSALTGQMRLDFNYQYVFDPRAL